MQCSLNLTRCEDKRTVSWSEEKRKWTRKARNRSVADQSLHRAPIRVSLRHKRLFTKTYIYLAVEKTFLATKQRERKREKHESEAAKYIYAGRLTASLPFLSVFPSRLLGFAWALETSKEVYGFDFRARDDDFFFLSFRAAYLLPSLFNSKNLTGDRTIVALHAQRMLGFLFRLVPLVWELSEFLRKKSFYSIVLVNCTEKRMVDHGICQTAIRNANSRFGRSYRNNGMESLWQLAGNLRSKSKARKLIFIE